MSDFFARHKDTLEAALTAIDQRGFWSPYPEAPSRKIYGETAQADGETHFKDMMNSAFDLPGHPSTGSSVGREQSPFGPDLNIRYPNVDLEDALSVAKTAMGPWSRATPEERAGVCLEILNRINAQSFLMAQAVMHTTGQAFIMAFQAGGPHAQDRGLEAVAYAYREMNRIPRHALWEKPQGKLDPLKLEKEFRLVPRGPSLMIGCATFPNWNGYPGLFASLVTGNPVLVKPHPMAILPLALSVRIGREVLAEAGFDPNVLLLVADEMGAEKTKDLVQHPDMAIVDFTGSNNFGSWVRKNAGEAQVYTEEAGINSIVMTGTDSFKGMMRNIAFSLSLYSGQMCTAPQNIFVPKTGIQTDDGLKTVDEIADGLKTALDKFLSDSERAASVCGAIQNPATLERVQAATALGKVIRASTPIEGMGDARSATPLLLQIEASQEDIYLEERFGPIAFLIVTDTAEDAITRAAQSAKQKGAITASVYATDEALAEQAADAFAAAGAALSFNLTGGIHVNQSAAFSDFHVSGANPAGNASLTDSAYVANRFRVVGIRRPVAA